MVLNVKLMACTVGGTDAWWSKGGLRAAGAEAGCAHDPASPHAGPSAAPVEVESAPQPAGVCLNDVVVVPFVSAPLGYTALRSAGPAAPSAPPSLLLPNQVEEEVAEVADEAQAQAHSGGALVQQAGVQGRGHAATADPGSTLRACAPSGTLCACARSAGDAGQPCVVPVASVARPAKSPSRVRASPCGVSVPTRAGPMPWRAYWWDGRFMMVAGAHHPPEFLLRAIAQRTPAHEPGYILRQRPEAAASPASAPNGAGAPALRCAESSSPVPSSPVQRPPAVCRREHPVAMHWVNAGLYGIFCVDPHAWQCCNTARASTGWASYHTHACPDCRRRAAEKDSEAVELRAHDAVERCSKF